jgi:hypothetical protein
MNDEIQQVVKRTRQYWFTDGFVEISMGGIFLILALYFYLQSVLPPESLILLILQAGFILVIFGTLFLGKRLVNRLKSRVTFPRSGYVAYQVPSNKQRILSMGIALVIAALIAGLFITTPTSLNWIPAITGFIVAIVWLISGARVGLIRFFVLSVVSMVLGTGLSLSGLETYFSLSIYYAAMGLSLILSGTLTLANYLRQPVSMNNDIATR